SERRAGSADVEQLDSQNVRERWPVGFISLKELVAKRRRGEVEGHGNVIWLMRPEEFQKRPNKNINCFCGHAGRRYQWGLHRRVKRPEDERHGVNQKQLLFLKRFRHRTPNSLHQGAPLYTRLARAANRGVTRRTRS